MRFRSFSRKCNINTLVTVTVTIVDDEGGDHENDELVQISCICKHCIDLTGKHRTPVSSLCSYVELLTSARQLHQQGNTSHL